MMTGISRRVTRLLLLLPQPHTRADRHCSSVIYRLPVCVLFCCVVVCLPGITWDYLASLSDSGWSAMARQSTVWKQAIPVTCHWPQHGCSRAVTSYMDTGNELTSSSPVPGKSNQLLWQLGLHYGWLVHDLDLDSTHIQVDSLGHTPTPFWSVLSCHLCFLPGDSHP